MTPPPPPPPPPSEAQVLENSIVDWTKLRTWLSQAKEKESQLRHFIANKLFASVRLPNGALPEGTNKTTATAETVDISAKCVQKYKWEVNEELMVVTLQEADLTPEQGKDLFRLKYELGMKAYKALPEEKRVIIDKMLTVKPASIELEVVTVPKE